MRSSSDSSVAAAPWISGKYGQKSVSAGHVSFTSRDHNRDCSLRGVPVTRPLCQHLDPSELGSDPEISAPSRPLHVTGQVDLLYRDCPLGLAPRAPSPMVSPSAAKETQRSSGHHSAAVIQSDPLSLLMDHLCLAERLSLQGTRMGHDNL